MAISGYYNQEALTRNANNPTSTTSSAPAGAGGGWTGTIGGQRMFLGALPSNATQSEAEAFYRNSPAYQTSAGMGFLSPNAYAAVNPNATASERSDYGDLYNQRQSRINYSDDTWAGRHGMSPIGVIGAGLLAAAGGAAAAGAFGGGGAAAGGAAGSGATAGGTAAGSGAAAGGAGAAGGASSIGTFGGFAPQATGFGVGSGGAAGVGGGIGGGITGGAAGGAAGTAGAGIGTWTRLGASAAGQLGSSLFRGGGGGSSSTTPQRDPRELRARTAWDMTGGDPQLQQQWIDWANNPSLHNPSTAYMPSGSGTFNPGVYGSVPQTMSSMGTGGGLNPLFTNTGSPDKRPHNQGGTIGNRNRMLGRILQAA